MSIGPLDGGLKGAGTRLESGTSRQTILVVEDEPMVRSLTARMLHRLGYRTVLAADARAALERLRDTPTISLVISDVVLPGGLDGVALAEACTALQPGLPVALASGYPQDALGRDARDPGRFALLSKPYSTDQLASFVARQLQRTG